MKILKTLSATIVAFVSKIGLRPIWSTKNNQGKPATLGKEAEEIINGNFLLLEEESEKKADLTRSTDGYKVVYTPDGLINLPDKATKSDALIASEYFTRESTFTNIAAPSIIKIEAASDWTGQYTGKLFLWYLNNGNNVSVRPSLYINRADSTGNIIATGAGIIAQYINDSFVPKSGIEEIEIKEVNFSGVNFKITIDWGKVPYTPTTLTSLNSVLNSAFFLEKYKKTPKELSLKSSTSDIQSNEVFMVNKVGDYMPLNTVRYGDLTWNNGKAYSNGAGIVDAAPMSYSNPIPVTAGTKINIPLIPSSVYCHVFLNASGGIIQYFGNLGATWQPTDLVTVTAPTGTVSVAFSWGTAIQYSQYFYAELPSLVAHPAKKWNDLVWHDGYAWYGNLLTPSSTANMSVSDRTEVFSSWIDTTTVPSAIMGFACFDKNLKFLGVINYNPNNWGTKKNLKLYHETKYISYSYGNAYKDTFSTQESTGVDFTITEKGLYLVTAKGKIFNVELLSIDTFEAAKLYTDAKIAGIEVGGYDYTTNMPVLPPQLFLRDDKNVFLYKKSLLSTISNSSSFGLSLSSNTANRKVLDITEPTPIGYNNFEGVAKLIIQQSNSPTKLVFKDIQIFKKTVSGLSGKTVKIMSLGDSLTEGLTWINTPITMLADALKEIGVITKFIGTLARNFTNKQGQMVKLNYEGRGGWRYRTLVGLESQFAGLNQVIPADQTKSEWMLGVDGSTMNSIKVNNSFLYPASAQDLINYPDWCFHFVAGNTVYNKSYTQDNTLGTYYIFDPARYFTLRNIEIPDILTMAFGTNEWYLPSYGGFDLAKAVSCLDFIITRFRQAAPNMKIVVIPAQALMIGRDIIWRDQYSKLCSNVMKVVEDKIAAGDNRLFICPIYAQSSRFLAFDNIIGVPANLAGSNSTKQVEVSQDVHYLYVDDESNDDYTESLAACVVNVME